jgi:glyoxylase-like metal-dependent hydrolase (beta-lactamase superfamily II)
MRDVAPGVLQLTLPLPWELKSVNIHVVKLSDGWMLVDAGIATDECFAVLEQGLASRGIGWSDLRILLLTHMHPDHVGLAERILAVSGARLYMHRSDAGHLASLASGMKVSPWFQQAMIEAGVPGDLQEKILKSFAMMGRNFSVLSPDVSLEGGETIPVDGDVLEVIWTPGHSAGHVCLYSPAHRYLISGDHLLNGITPNISWHPDHDTLGEYLSSLEKLTHYEIDTVLPSHGRPFDDHRGWIRDTAAHHADRCREIREAMARGDRTAHQMVASLWSKSLSPFHHQFAVLETLAHLEYMRRKGELRTETGPAGERSWLPAA